MNDTARTPAARAAIWYALSAVPLIPLLVWGPTWVPADPSIESAASVEGYNNVFAYQLAVGWLALVFAGWWWTSRGATLPSPVGSRSAGEVPRGRRWIERAIVIVAVAIALWPAALAPSGAYIEDAILMNASHRILAGMVPYRDFEFLYGPAMIVPLARWLGAAGFSLENYYGYLAVMETIGYLAVLVVVQRLVPEPGRRAVIFLLFAALIANPLLGLNSVGLRRLLPLAALFVLSRDPASVRWAAVAGVILGVGLAFSHDSAVAAGIGAAAMYLGGWWLDRRLRGWQAAVAFGLATVVSWLALALTVMGPDFGSYLTEVRLLVARFSAGEAGFRFYWTVNALALFGVLVGVVIWVARGFGAARRPIETAWGDRWLLAVLVVTVIQLKSGLNRADVWHLCGGALPLVAGVLLPLPRRVFRTAPSGERLAFAAIVVVAATYVIGQAPTASYVAQGWLEGWRAGPARPPVDVTTAAPALELRRPEPDSDVVEVTRYFADPARRGQPVYFYGTLWGIGPRIGVPKRDPINDDFLYAAERAQRVVHWLETNAVPFVLMTRSAEARLFDRETADPLAEYRRRVQPSAMKSIGSWAATVHYRALEVELPLQDARWRKSIGPLIKRDYVSDTIIGEYVVLRRRTSQ